MVVLYLREVYSHPWLVEFSACRGAMETGEGASIVGPIFLGGGIGGGARGAWVCSTVADISLMDGLIEGFSVELLSSS